MTTPTSSDFKVDNYRITNDNLSGTANYMAWSKAVTRFLKGKDMLLHITAPPPDSKAADFAKWDRDDAIIINMMTNCMEKSVCQSVVFLETAKEIWDTLQQLYSSVNNMQRLFDIFRDIYETKQGEDLQSYLSRFTLYLEEWKLYQPYSTDIAVQQKQREALLAVLALGNVRPYLEGVRSHILATHESPSLKDLSSQLPRVAPPAASDLPAPSALATGRGFSEGSFRGTRGRGFSRGRGDRGRGRGRSTGYGGNTKYCTFCQGTNHIYETCWQRLGRPTSAHHASQVTDSSSSTSAPQGDSTAASQVTLTAEEYTAFRSLLSKSSSNSAQSGTACLVSSHQWIIDSGASEHMTPLPLLSFTPLTDTHVRIADGSPVSVKGIGVVNPTNTIRLKSVLQIPTFSSSLLSVRKLCVDLHCSVTFFPSYCVFQDITTKKVIGAGHEHQGLYILDQPGSLTALSATADSVL